LTTPTHRHAEVKARQQKTWSSGDYGKVAWLTSPLADVLVEAVDLRPGATLLDVATGTGNVALAAAHRFCTVTGIDYVPALLDVAGRRASAEGLDVTFREADAEQLPFADGSFDYVVSAIGSMFAPDHVRTAGEMARVCAPDGVIGVASWTPGGFVGGMLKTVGSYVAPPPGVQPPPLWGTEAHPAEIFGSAVGDFTCTTTQVTERFPSSAHFADFFIEHYGPTRKAAEVLDDDARAAFRADLVALADAHNRATDGTLVCDWEYLVAVGRKA
jgi:SAM-dependent methyltransferase